MDHEQAFVSVFIVPEKRTRYAEFLAKPKRRVEITNRFSHSFDFVPALAKQVSPGTASELAPLLRVRGAGEIAHVIGGRNEIDGKELPLEEAIDGALADPGGVVVSCIRSPRAIHSGVSTRRHIHFELQAMTPSKADAPNPAMTLGLHSDRQWRGAGDLRR